MSVIKEDSLSPEELRKRLYQTFKNRGVLDTLKTQLRNQLIHELKPAVLSGEAVARPLSRQSDSVLMTASNSLVADHLHKSGLEYSLSVFYPECGLNKDKVFTTKDLLQLLKISPQSPLYRSMASKTLKDNKGFLMSLLIELTDHHLHGEHCDADTQTTVLPSHRESLVDKMKLIDEEYESLRHRGDRWVPYETKLAAYRKEVEAQVQAEMNTKLQHFKEVEMAKLKMEEKHRSNKELLELRQTMERSYELKAEALISREKNAIDRLQKQQEIEEKEVYMQRQAVLKQMDIIRNGETELKMRIEAFEKTCKLQEEKTKVMEDLLRRRELAVKTMEDTYDQKLKNELSKYQLELKEDYIKRTEKLTENEEMNKVESVRIQEEASRLDARVEEHTRACSELRRLQVDLDAARSQASILTQQTELLRERLETQADYPSLKRERLELAGQTRLLRTQLEEAQAENLLLQTALGRPSEEQLGLQAELRRLEGARRLDQEDFDTQRQVLQTQLQTEVERCAQLTAQLADCEERNQWVTAHAEDLRMQLRQTQQALENEVLRAPKPSLVELGSARLLSPDVFVAAHHDLCEAGVAPPRGRRLPWSRRSSSPDLDVELVAGAKARIRELEKEAETLEEAYRNYQQRALHASIPHMLPPPRPLSPPPQRTHFSHPRPLSPPRPSVCRSPLQRPQASPRPLSPSRPPQPQPRVTFSEGLEGFPGPGSGRGLQPLNFSESDPQEGRSSPCRRLSSTPLSLSLSLNGRPPQTETVKAACPPLPFPQLSSDRSISPIPRGEVASSGHAPADLGQRPPSPDPRPPTSPPLQSTAREQSSPSHVQQVISSSESSPQPDKIQLEDLTEPLPEPRHIPALLLDTAGPRSEETPATPDPRDLPEIPPQAEKLGDVKKTPDEPSGGGEEQEEEDLRWEEERKEREERRQRQREEAQERELRELARLEEEKFGEEHDAAEEEREDAGVEESEQKEVQDPGEESGQKEVQGPGEEESEQKEVQGPGEEESEQKGVQGPEDESTDADPLQKYMKMVLEARQTQDAQSSERVQPEQRSPEAPSVSEEKDHSIGAFSQKDLDDDFW